LLPHSRSHDPRNLLFVIALDLPTGSELISKECGHAHARAGENILANNGDGELATAGVLARLKAGPKHAVHVPEYHLPQTETHKGCSSRRLHRRKWACKSSNQFHTSGIRAGKERKIESIDACELFPMQDHAVHVPEYHLPQTETHKSCSCRRLHRRKWACKSSNQFHTSGIRASKERKVESIDACELFPMLTQYSSPGSS
jgi:hypothetical protein